MCSIYVTYVLETKGNVLGDRLEIPVKKNTRT